MSRRKLSASAAQTKGSVHEAEEGSAAVDEQEPRAYADPSYWDSRYSRETQDDETDEWCLDFNDLTPIFEGLRRVPDDGIVVDIGCGSSTFLFDARAAGWECDLLGLDYSQVAVDVQTSKAKELGCLVSFERCDVAALDQRFEPDSVDMFVDKMTMDAILHGEDGEALVSGLAASIARALKAGGVWVLVSQMHVEENEEFFGELLESLGKGALAHWHVTAHLSSGDSGIHVYTFLKQGKHSMALRRPGRGGVVRLSVVEH
mmetsp:Transcript_8825/g.16182  ORF Transcript_8825/g.16182 Transcript_8825/m.16182 type:complete len:260 (-) Transcript_8825:309-1088(-)